MCHFISLVTCGLGLSQIESVLQKHGRSPSPSRIQSLQKVLIQDEQQFLTRIGECDCGTALAHQDNTAVFDVSKELRKLLDKGWPLKKAQRSVASKEESAARNQRIAIDSYELWQKIAEDLLATKGSQHVGLMLHFYKGDQNTEEFHCVRKAVKLPHLFNALTELSEDTLLVISR